MNTTWIVAPRVAFRAEDVARFEIDIEICYFVRAVFRNGDVAIVFEHRDRAVVDKFFGWLIERLVSNNFALIEIAAFENEQVD